MNNSRLCRIVQGSVIGGVAGGIAEFFGMDPTIVRLLFVLLVVFGGSGILLYIILWIILPEKPLMYDPFRVYTPPPTSATGQEFKSGIGETYEGFDHGVPPQQTQPATPANTERKKIEGSLIGGTLLIFIGVIFLADRFIPNIDFGDLWPIILIALGILLIFTNLPQNKKDNTSYSDPASGRASAENFPASHAPSDDEPKV